MANNKIPTNYEPLVTQLHTAMAGLRDHGAEIGLKGYKAEPWTGSAEWELRTNLANSGLCRPLFYAGFITARPVCAVGGS